MDDRRRHILAIAALPAMLPLANGVVAQEPFPNINDAEGHLYAALSDLAASGTVRFPWSQGGGDLPSAQRDLPTRDRQAGCRLNLLVPALRR